MLVLSRKQNEKIRIGSNVVIKIVSLTENQVKIGIEAPSDVKILREEIYENVKQHTIEASKKIALGEIPDFSKLNINKIKIETSDNNGKTD
jgi:carbon storage regulator CsrA